MSRVGLEPATESRLIATVGLIVQHTEPRQRRALLLRGDGDTRTIVHDTFSAQGSRTLALQASRARIICFSTAL